ncbi:MAG: hypothetical protein KKA79_04930, partial [Nanoarchaeota archaeon]|nr:hypothetical protein [Nanoarchaeota archaeon]
KYNRGWTIKKISDHYNIPYRPVLRWVNKKNRPIPYIEYKKVKKQFTKTEINNLAPVLGNIFGDGHINSHGIICYCNTEEILINNFIRNVGKIFDEEPLIAEGNDYAIRVSYPNRVGRALWCIFGEFARGGNTKTITSQINQMPIEWKGRMLRTWFDDDGSVPKQGIVSIKQKFKHLIRFIQKTLSEMKIRSQISADDGAWQLRICSKRDLIRFKENVGFSDEYRKNKKLKDIIESKGVCHFETKEKILNSLRDSQKTTEELAQDTGIKSGNIIGHLYGWKRRDKNRKSTKGLIESGFVGFRKKDKGKKYFLNKKIITKSYSNSYPISFL